MINILLHCTFVEYAMLADVLSLDMASIKLPTIEVRKEASNLHCSDHSAARTDQEADVEPYLPLYPRMFGAKSDRRQTTKKRCPAEKLERYFSNHESWRRMPDIRHGAKERHGPQEKALLAVSRAGLPR